MSEETQRNEVVTDPVETPEVPTATQVDRPESPSAPEAGNDTTQDQEVPAVSSPNPPDDEVERRAAGKLKQTQEELAQVKRQEEAYRAYILKSPDRVKEALIEVDGYTEEQANTYVADMRKRNPSLWQDPNAPVPAAPVVEDPRAAAWEVVNTHERQKRFWSALPELDPARISSDEEKSKAGELAIGVEYQATLLKAFNPNLTDEEAWKKGYMVLTGKTEEQLLEAQEKGRIEGLVSGAQDNASTRSPASGGQPVKGSVKLTEYESDIARQAGMSPEEYAKWRDGE